MPLSSLPSFNETLRSLPLLDNAAAGHGVLSIDSDRDGVFRRVPLVSHVSGRLAPSLSLEMLRLVAKAPWIDLYLKRGGVRGVAVGPLAVPTQSDGSVWVNYSPHDPLRFVSAAAVLSNHVAANEFDRRIVLIGVTGLGTTDQRLTPVGYMPGSEIHAQLLENILDGRLARRPDWSAAAEPALTFLFGLFLIVTPRRWCGRAGRSWWVWRRCSCWRQSGLAPGGSPCCWSTVAHAGDRPGFCLRDAFLVRQPLPKRDAQRQQAAPCNWNSASWRRPESKANWKRDAASRWACCRTPPASPAHNRFDRLGALIDSGAADRRRSL